MELQDFPNVEPKREAGHGETKKGVSRMLGDNLSGSGQRGRVQKELQMSDEKMWRTIDTPMTRGT